MTATQTKTLNVFAPAKVNLYLHVTGRLEDGYHELDSLVCFVDIGDQIRIEAHHDLSFEVAGPYASGFNDKETDQSPHSSNLVVQAIWSLAQAAQKTPDVKVTLEKNLPLAAGIGGGSTDAAAVIWALCEWWDIPRDSDYLPALLQNLGADVPICFQCAPARMKNAGDVFDPVHLASEFPVVLVNPGKPCPTPQVFQGFCQNFKDRLKLPSEIKNFDNLIGFLEKTGNDLYESACQIVPDIENVQRAIGLQAGCRLARMSGSGATCFGLFATEQQAKEAADKISFENPDWWVKSGLLNRPERY